MVRLSSAGRESDGRDGVHRAGLARSLKAQGKDVVELEIGDSPFPSTPHAKATGIRGDRGEPDRLLLQPWPARVPRGGGAVRPTPSSASTSAAENVVVASGAKPFEQYFAEALLDPGDGVLIFSPHFPTYVPEPPTPGRPRGDRAASGRERVPAPRQRRRALPRATTRSRAGVFLNSPHNPTGGVATRDDLAEIADVVRGTDLMVLSDEPYCHMVWEGRHESILAQPGMIDHVGGGLYLQQVVQHERLADRVRGGASRSGRGDRQADQHHGLVQPAVRPVGRPGRARAGRADPRRLHGAVPPQGRAAHRRPGQDRRHPGRAAGGHVLRLPRRPRRSAIAWASPRTAWRSICSKGPTTRSASPAWAASASAPPAPGFLRFSCAEPDERIDQAVDFLPQAFDRGDRVRTFLAANPQFALATPYE